MSKIIELRASNVKRLRAVSIRPDGAMVVIGGANANGKSSCLDSIAYAIGGKSLVPAEPIRRGESKAEIEVETDDFRIKRTFTASGGSYLTVEDKEGKRVTSPQEVLNKMTGSLTFDPLEFSRMDTKKQLETLRWLVKLDFSELDERYKTLYEERTIINRRLKDAEGALSKAVVHNDAPKAEVSVAELTKQLQDAIAFNATRTDADRRVDEANRQIQRCNERIAELESSVALAKQTMEQWADERNKAQELLDTTKGIALEPINAQITNVESVNRKVRDNQNRAKLAGERDKLSQESSRLSTAMDDIASEKKEMLASAKFPVPGLSFDENGVTLNGLPFEQASSAEQLKVSVAMGLALNPTLKVLLVRDGSLLDSASLKMIEEMVTAEGGQIWLEKVSEDGVGCTVVIEDGAVREPAPVG